MQYLKDTRITGPKHHIANLRKVFGMTYFGAVGGVVELSLTHVLANSGYVGVNSTGQKPSISRTPLYVLVPSGELEAVWPPLKNQVSAEVSKNGEIEVRLGSASKVGDIHICKAVGIRVGNSVLYLCLDPKGWSVDKTSNMGV